MDLLDKLRAISRRMEPLASAEFRPFFTTIESVVNPGEVIIRGHRTLMFGSNNYFGLTSHPEVIAAAKEAIDLYGSGTTGSRIANGTFAAHESLGARLRALLRYARSQHLHHRVIRRISMVGALCGPGDVIMLDAESHASLCDAARLSGAEAMWVQHNFAEESRD
jgi:8-amino-7-oxononanoate synthase